MKTNIGVHFWCPWLSKVEGIFLFLHLIPKSEKK